MKWGTKKMRLKFVNALGIGIFPFSFWHLLHQATHHHQSVKVGGLGLELKFSTRILKFHKANSPLKYYSP